MRTAPRVLVLTVAVGLALVAPSRTASAHCDTLNGPVVAAARLALEKGDVTPVLKWVKAGDEAEIRHAFAQTLAVRKAGPQARDLADRYFFETLVRIHRQGEGAPYTGLKPAETALDPAIEAADKALDRGSVDPLVDLVGGDVTAGIRRRFARVATARPHADHDVAAGREFVEAYVDYVHYVEALRVAAAGTAPSHGAAPAETPAGAHVHK